MAHGSAALAALALARFPHLAAAFPGQPGAAVVPWLDPPPPNPVPDVVGALLEWERFGSFLTPAEQFFTVAHYGRPAIDVPAWKLDVSGLVQRPLTLTLDALKARPRQEVVFTLECSGNHGFPWFTGGVGTARWAGTPLAPLLAEAGVLERAVEVAFWGADAGEEAIRDATVRQHFARSLALADAMDSTTLLCYEMNGAPLPPAHGFPLRLIAPGWYGIANVKWLTRIEVRDTRLMNRFMARDYVTLRQETRDGEPAWTETSVGRARLKSVPATVTRAGGQYRIIGAAWGAGRAGGGADRRRGVGAGGARPQRGGVRRVAHLVAGLGHARPRRAHHHLAGDRHPGRRPAGDGRSLDRHEADLLGEHRPGHPAHPHHDLRQSPWAIPCRSAINDFPSRRPGRPEPPAEGDRSNGDDRIGPRLAPRRLVLATSDAAAPGRRPRWSGRRQAAEVEVKG
jgi:DMSO/TMAO reductase YedYZ molybdopterin-dependent catalytic subunit